MGQLAELLNMVLIGRRLVERRRACCACWRGPGSHLGPCHSSASAAGRHGWQGRSVKQHEDAAELSWSPQAGEPDARAGGHDPSLPEMPRAGTRTT